MSMEERVIALRRSGVNSSEVARRCGITRRAVNAIMRAESRKRTNTNKQG